MKTKLKNLKTGYTLLTSNTNRWTKEQWDKNDKIEELMLFENFTHVDFGKGRNKVATCESKEIANEMAVKCNGYDSLLGENNRLKEALEGIGNVLDFCINATPTGAVRNLLTDANIIAKTVLDLSTVKEVGDNG